MRGSVVKKKYVKSPPKNKSKCHHCGKSPLLIKVKQERKARLSLDEENQVNIPEAKQIWLRKVAKIVQPMHPGNEGLEAWDKKFGDHDYGAAELMKFEHFHMYHLSDCLGPGLREREGTKLKGTHELLKVFLGQ
jgi:hypothetical protein